MAKSLRQRLNENYQAKQQAAADQKLVASWWQGIKFKDSQARGQAALDKRAAAKKAGRAKARDIFLKDQA